MSQNREVLLLLSALQSSMFKKIDRKLSAHGISFSEFLIMYNLNDAPNNTMRRTDLAESVGLTASGVTRLLNPMEKNRLVEKESNARDARVSLVKLSTPGKRIFKDALTTFDFAADEILNPVNDKQTEKLLEIVKSLLMRN